MWGGPRFGPRGTPFRGNLQGPRFAPHWREETHDGPAGPFPKFGGRAVIHPSMNPQMGFRPMDRPPLDIRGRDGHPPGMRGRDLEPIGIRGRDVHFRDFRARDTLPMDNRGRFDLPVEMRERDAIQNIRGRGGHDLDIRGRDGDAVGLRGFGDPLIVLGKRERLPMDIRGRDGLLVDTRRRLPLDILGCERRSMNIREREESNMDLRERFRHPMGDEDIDGLSMDMEVRDGASMAFGRRGMPPVPIRGRYGSDMDFRSRSRPSVDLRGGDESLVHFMGSDGVPPDVKGRDVLSSDFGGWKGPSPKFRGGDGSNKRDFRERGEPPFRSREEPRQENWRSAGFGGSDGFPVDMHQKGVGALESKERERLPLARESLDFRVRERIPGDFQESSEFRGRESNPVKDSFGFQSQEREPLDSQDWKRNSSLDPLSFGGREATLHRSRTGVDLLGRPGDQNEDASFKDVHLHNKDTDSLLGRNNSALDELESKAPLIAFPESEKPSAGPQEEKAPELTVDFQGKKDSDYKDQDYRDSDYRVTSGQTFDYGHGNLSLEEPQKKTEQPPAPSSSDFSFQDQDYRSGSIKEKVSSIISVKGICKNATSEEILSAFTYTNGVRPQGMKIKDIVPGYSYDTAFVEFLNLEDAVRFMESNQRTLKIGGRAVSMQYSQPDWNSKDGDPQDSQPTPASAPTWTSTQLDPVFQESKTMIIKHLWPSTTVEHVLKALDPFAYLDERNVRLMKRKPGVGTKCLCFVDMDSHQEVTRLVEILRNLSVPFMINGSRVHVEIARPLKNHSFKKDFEKATVPSNLGHNDPNKQGQQPHPLAQEIWTSTTVQEDSTMLETQVPSEALYVGQPVSYTGTPAPEHLSSEAVDAHLPIPADPNICDTTTTVAQDSALLADDAATYPCTVPDVSTYLYDSTSGFYYDPQTTLYYDTSSRYYYNAQTQQYLYWDNARRNYFPVPNYTAEDQPPASSSVVTTVPSAEQKEEETTAKPDKKEKEKDDKPRGLTAHKIAKDMERWAKIQNRQKESIRVASPVLQLRGSSEEKKTSKAADAAFAIFEKKGLAGEDLFKKPFAPTKKEKDEVGTKQQVGSLGVLVAEYGGDSDEEEDKQEEPREERSQPVGVDKLTDWKKMACLLCRRQFPNKDALIRHQKLSELHKQNMEIHQKIKRSERELEALERQEREVNVSMSSKGGPNTPESKRRKYQSSVPKHPEAVEKRSRMGFKEEQDMLEPVEKKKKGSGRGTPGELQMTARSYREAVRKAMFARYKELE
ncbi:RNA-binding protein 5-like isoform X1 [Polyodon spathula]|uniref:RNA-binding protein 5-like isoform X1 n=1 Tax=Polyodon spathula TaxID=7913 RepID=UPI001B7E3320|nr:RNA-binding protein 5-like isoform X1 [Polyodon spathula]